MPQTIFNPFGAFSAKDELKYNRSNFNLGYKRAFNCGYGRLVPVLCEPVMPTDNFELGAEFLLRTSPFVSQVFQRYDVDLSWFYVPNRVLWNNFDLFLSGGYSGTEEFVHPYIDLRTLFNLPSVSDFYPQSIFDYMDIPLPNPAIQWEAQETKILNMHINALPFWALARIYLDHFVSQHFGNADQIDRYMRLKYMCVDGNQLPALATIFNHFQRFGNSTDDGTIGVTTFQALQDFYDWDYFTSALPEQQHGPVMSIPVDLVDSSDGVNLFQLSSAATSTNTSNVAVQYTSGSSIVQLYPTTAPSMSITLNGQVLENRAVINDLRSAMILTDFFESLGYSGFRPEDYNLSQFGAKSANHNLMQSQMIGYQRFTVNIGEVFSNNQSLSGDDVPGAATSTAKGYGSSRSFRYKVPEYGYIIALMSVKPEAGYSQGIPKHYGMLDRFDYPNPRFAKLGLDTIKRWELVYNENQSCLQDFGYTTRYSNYRTNYNRVNGQLRANGNHYDMTAQRLFPKTDNSQFPTGPVLNDQFRAVHVNYNFLNRTFNTQFEDPKDGPIFIDLFNRVYANRPLEHNGLPRVM